MDTYNIYDTDGVTQRNITARFFFLGTDNYDA